MNVLSCEIRQNVQYFKLILKCFNCLKIHICNLGLGLRFGLDFGSRLEFRTRLGFELD